MKDKVNNTINNNSIFKKYPELAELFRKEINNWISEWTLESNEEKYNRATRFLDEGKLELAA